MERNNVNKVGFILLIITLLFSGCSKLTKKYGTAFNSERKRLGIPSLPGNWHLQKDFYDNEHIQWRKSGNAFNCYYFKSIELRNGRIISDNSVFIGQDKYLADESQVNKTIRIACLFPEINSRQKEKIVILYHHNEYSHYFPDTLTKSQMDSVFAVWRVNPRLAWGGDVLE